MSASWKPTKHNGFRRTGVAQVRKSNVQIRRRSEVQILPPVLIKWNEKLGLPNCPYVIRWRLETPIGSIRIHHWISSDDDRAFHDHPWWFLTFVFRGGYTDRSPVGDEHIRAPAIRYRSALHRHTVVPDHDGAWTILITGKKTRAWGFWLNGKFRKANKWFATYGHHPCD